jgi:C4-dicarboxylate-specific signal transduction histidine kinase
VNQCCKIRARALDFIEGRTDMFAAASEIRRLAFWARLQGDPDVRTIEGLLSEATHLPTGREREYWAPEALAREDKEIGEIERRWNERIKQAARNLATRYEWAIERRAELARLGVHGPE